jgi:hypothetical protein
MAMIKFSRKILAGQGLPLKIEGLEWKSAKYNGTAFSFRRALLWISAFTGVSGLIYGFDFTFEVILDGMSLLIEFGQETLETIYRKQFKLDLYHAQMATAYSGFLIILVSGYFILRKIALLSAHARASFAAERKRAVLILASQWHRIKFWWLSLDNYNKVFAAIGVIVLGIPFISLFCLILGKLVAEFI